MGPQLDAAQHILNETLLREGPVQRARCPKLPTCLSSVSPLTYDDAGLDSECFLV